MSDATVATAPVHQDQPRKLPGATDRFSIRESSFAFPEVDVTVPLNHTPDDVMLTEYWASHAHRLKKAPMSGGGDRTGAVLYVRRDDHAFLATLYVRGVLQNGLIVQCTGPSIDPETGRACPIDLKTGLPWRGDKASEHAQFARRWNVGKRGYDVIRKSDKEVVADASQFPTPEQADSWIEKMTGA